MAVCDFEIIFIPLLLLCTAVEENGEDEPGQTDGIEATCCIICSLLQVTPITPAPALQSRLMPPPAMPDTDVVDRGVVDAGGVAILLGGSELLRLRSLVPLDICLFVITSVSSLVKLLAFIFGE